MNHDKEDIFEALGIDSQIYDDLVDRITHVKSAKNASKILNDDANIKKNSAYLDLMLVRIIDSALANSVIRKKSGEDPEFKVTQLLIDLAETFDLMKADKHILQETNVAIILSVVTLLTMSGLPFSFIVDTAKKALTLIGVSVDTKMKATIALANLIDPTEVDHSIKERLH